MKLHKAFDCLFHLLWLTLFAMAIVMYKERLFADASYYFFHAINSAWFHVEHGRVVLGISQLLPLMGYYLGLPLKILMLLASVGHELFYYAIFLLCYYKLKDQATAIAVLLIHLIGQLWLYYSPMLEICYGAALAALLYALLKSEKYKDDKWLMLMLLVQWFAMSSHPENFILIGLVIAYDIINRGFQKRIHGITIGFAALGFLLELLSFSEYESNHVNFIEAGKQSAAVNLFKLDYAKEVLELFTTYYPELVVMLLLASILTWYRKRNWTLLLMLASVSTVLLLINQLYFANEFTRYYESAYSPLVGIVVLVFVHEVFHLSQKWAIAALASFAIVMASNRMIWIWDFGADLRQRSEQLDRIVDHAQTLGKSKYLINIGNYQRPYSDYTWANPIESLLYSAIDGPENTVTIAEENEVNYEKNYLVLNDSNFMFRRFEVLPVDFLNQHLFHLDQEPYHYLNQAFSNENLDELQQNVSLSFVAPKLSHEAGDTVITRLAIENRSKTILRSKVNEGVSLSYHWLQEEEVIEWDGMRTYLEVDVHDRHAQDQLIVMPNKAGKYTLVPDLVIEGKMWFDLKASVEVYVKPKSDTSAHSIKP